MDFVIYVGSKCLHVYICTQKSDLCSELFVVCIGMGGLGRKMAYVRDSARIKYKLMGFMVYF
jgi:hypothetical protein